LRRIASTDAGYISGDLSLFPTIVDDRDSLYRVENNAETKLKSGISYNSKQIIVLNTAGFPDKGLLRIGSLTGITNSPELIYYGSKTTTTFKNITRGFAGSRQNPWPSGSYVTNSVCAEHHNAVKDALINMQKKTGLKILPENNTINRKLKDLELRYLSPKAIFRAFPKKALPNTPIRFQSLCEGDIIRYLWDFGDGNQSVDQNPTYTYANEGLYTVKLYLITTDGAQGISTKNNYITISNEEFRPFFYVKNVSGRTYRFIDQTDGSIIQRFWVFGDGEKYTELDPNIHEYEYTYLDAGTYSPSLLIAFTGNSIKRTFLKTELVVI